MQLSGAVDPFSPGPVWMILTSPDPAAPRQLTATITNVGHGRAHDVTIRKVWRRGLGPSLAHAPVVEPESEILLELDLPDAERHECGITVEWHEEGRRRRQHVSFGHSR